MSTPKKKPESTGKTKKGSSKTRSSKLASGKNRKAGGAVNAKPAWPHINGKPILERIVKTVLTLIAPQFQHKLLCDALVLNLGDACAFKCTYCYVMSVIFKLVAKLINLFNRTYGTHFGFQDFVILRANSIEVLRKQLLDKNGKPRYKQPGDTRVVFTSTLVDPAATMKLLRETAAACMLILEHTNWQIRILSKCSLLKLLIQKEMIPKEYHSRLILGFSIGTLDDKLAKAIEINTSPPSLRLKALHWLQDHGIRTFGMICPSFPQKDYRKFSREMCKAIRVDRCEHVWGECINVRGQSRTKTLKALVSAGLVEAAELFRSVFEPPVVLKSANAAKMTLREAINALKNGWENYARQTFEAHCENVPPGKLRFLQYATKETIDWWAAQRDRGAVPIGKVAANRMLLAGGESAPLVPLPDLTEADIRMRNDLEEVIHKGLRSNIEIGVALHRVRFHKDGLLWRKGNYFSFEDYCDARFRYAKAHGYRMSNVGGLVVAIAESKGVEATYNGMIPLDSLMDCLPASPGQIRPLLEMVPEEHQLPCWNKILETNTPSELTGAIVEEMSKNYLRKNKIVSKKAKANAGKTEKDKKSPVASVLLALEKLRVAIAGLPQPTLFDNYLKGMSWLLEKQATASGKKDEDACGCGGGSGEPECPGHPPHGETPPKPDAD